MKTHSITPCRYALLALAAVTVLALATPATAQTLFVSEGSSGIIVKITPSGTVTTFASGFNHNNGLAFDRSGNLYVTNDNSTIDKIVPDGTVTTFASGLSDNPQGLAFDGSGNLYVSNLYAGTISEITPGGTVTTFASGLSAPGGLAFDGSGNLYVGMGNGGTTIDKIAPNGTVTTFASGLVNPVGLAFDGSGNLYVGYGGTTIDKIAPSGTVTTFAPGFNNPGCLAFDASGNLYVDNADGNTISKITPGGTVTTFASGLTGPAFIAIQPSISGTVTNRIGGPIQGATVSMVVSGTTYSATTTANGTYMITGVPVGTGYTVTASEAGYANGTVTSVNVTANNTTANVNITLNASSYAAWADTAFTTAQLADPTISGETANPANDGVPNLLKYAFNLNPLVPNRSGLPVVGTITSGGNQYLTITYTTQPQACDLTYSVQASTDMVNWTAITPAAPATTTPVTVQDTTPLSAGIRRFLRVVVVGP